MLLLVCTDESQDWDPLKSPDEDVRERILERSRGLVTEKSYFVQRGLVALEEKWGLDERPLSAVSKEINNPRLCERGLLMTRDVNDVRRNELMPCA